MIILVCGDRTWKDAERIRNVLSSLLAEHGTFKVIEGGAHGADWCAWNEALSLGLEVQTVKAEWKKYGPSAGPKRNRKMLDMKPDLVVAFHNDWKRSRGTKDCIREALRRGIPVEVWTTTDRVVPGTSEAAEGRAPLPERAEGDGG